MFYSEDEVGRLASLRGYAILDTEPEIAFDDLTRLAAQVCGVPIAVVSLVDATRQWFKARVGLEAAETARDVSFCSHAIRGTGLFVVPDASADGRFAANPLVTDDPSIRFYAGYPLVNRDGYALGTLCVIDRTPRELTPAQAETLMMLGRQVLAQLELRRALADARRAAGGGARFGGPQGRRPRGRARCDHHDRPAGHGPRIQCVRRADLRPPPGRGDRPPPRPVDRSPGLAQGRALRD